MSRKVDIKSLTNKDLEKISRDLEITREQSKYTNASPESFSLLEVQDNFCYLPFAYAENFPRPERSSFTERKIKFEGKLRENQKEVRKEAVDKLNSQGSVIIAAHPGFGKTSMGIEIASRIKLKTLIVCHRVVIVNQWKDSIKKFCPTAKVQVLTSKSSMKDADFYIANAIIVPKHSRDFYKDIGFMILDEAHILMADKLSQCARSVVPRYVLGLSATPYRNDGLGVLLDLYFGTHKIIRKLYRKHTVYRFNTGFKPEVKMNKMGKVDWNSVLESQCSNVERNEDIIKIIQYFPDRTFLVLCKRVDQANYLVKRLKEENEDVTSLIGSNQKYEQSSRVLVGTVSKTGVGFDHPDLNALILASDVEQYFIQYLGRVFRREDSEPVIFDLLDNYGLLFKHFKTRNAVYVEHGGTVKDFHKEFPDF